MLPNFIVAGVNKAGTTSLFSYLAAHPDVGASSIKETCHFLPVRYGEPVPPLSDYEQYFEGCEDSKVVMEATPGYFYGGEPLARTIDTSVPGVRVAIVFRDPVSRLISFFRFQQTRLFLPASMTLAEYVERCDEIDPEQLQADRTLNPYFGVLGGYYDRWLDAWLETFDDRIQVLFAEGMHRDPGSTLETLAMWLGIDPEAFPAESLTTENRTVAYRHASAQRVALAVNERLERLFRSQPAMKRRLRSLYYRFNTGEPGDKPDAALLDALRARYRASMEATEAKLRTAGITVPSAWLAA